MQMSTPEKYEKHEINQRKRHDKGEDNGVIIPAIPSALELPEDYIHFFLEIKEKIRKGRLKAVASANSSLVMMYWEIGSAILAKQENEGWGAKVIDRLSSDLRKSFPEMNGFSARNLKYMRKFAEVWTEKEIVQRTVALIPWRSNLTLLEKINEPELRLWYARQTLENGWSKSVLEFQIDTKLHMRIGKTSNNFDLALPPLDSDMTNQIFKDPYIFDFLGTAEVRKEAELEIKLIDHMEKSLLELGQGFAFVGHQFHMEIGGEDFYIDMLFYHLKLRCFIVVELKAGKFCPGHVS